ncbi:translation initiation factor IF-2 [Candidatus Woesearchaeota archaeon]|nr:translation initiation factor IF-2 [Candidatus Woesearchaeota archaeon]MCF7901344.1 translation initiation factor IF-2 [Candidatus Woesearchaeota archaeon]MCF8014041.1 translation initiation factor IF-2 [Candidatus Woesearchaeota archaeon]
MAIRSPIVSVLGHVDHGKSSILDSIRGTNIVSGEAGAITQAIGASVINIDTVKKRCGTLIDSLKMNITLPGLLFIDTPGHAAFTSLRKRGGSIADIAIVVIDINEGLKPQTIEAIEILRSSKTPFVIAANKIDLVSGYYKKNSNFLGSFNDQRDDVKQILETKLYELVGVLHNKFGLNAERYDRVDDYTKQVAIIPCSAKEQIGLEEILMVITGLAQKFLEQNLALNVMGSAKGIILEVKEDKGLGKTLDVILYDGSLKIGEQVVIGTMNEPVVAKIRALFMPEDLKDMRDKKSKFKSVKEVFAATGVKISSPDLNDNIVAGMPVLGIRDSSVDSVKETVMTQINEVTFDTDKDGVVVKADTLGSLEALLQLLKEKDISVRKASIGNINKKDILDAESNLEKNPLHSVVLGFNIKEESSTENVKIIVKDIIYSLIDDYELWVTEKKDVMEAEQLENLTRPSKIEVLNNCIFRQSNPCIAGIEVLGGVAKSGMKIMNQKGVRVGEIKTFQMDKKNVPSVETGLQVAAQMPGLTAGRQIIEGEIYYSDLNEEEFRKLKYLIKFLKPDEKGVLKEIISIKRESNPVWGV